MIHLIFFQPEVNMIEIYYKMILDHMDTFGVVFYMNFLDKIQPVEL